jgi:hypothetical protein
VQELEQAVKRHFFLHSARTRKVNDKLVHYTHYEERQNVVIAIGYDKWERMGQAEEFGDIYPPACFSYLFNIFLDIYYFCPNGISYTDIASYCASAQEELSIYEIRLIRRMATWAASEVNKAFKESH